MLPCGRQGRERGTFCVRKLVQTKLCPKPRHRAFALLCTRGTFVSSTIGPQPRLHNAKRHGMSSVRRSPYSHQTTEFNGTFMTKVEDWASWCDIFKGLKQCKRREREAEGQTHSAEFPGCTRQALQPRDVVLRLGSCLLPCSSFPASRSLAVERLR